MRFLLSKLIPVPMHSRYTVMLDQAYGQHDEDCHWWQWRGRIFRYRSTIIRGA